MHSNYKGDGEIESQHETLPAELAREKRLAALHEALAAEMGQASFYGEDELHLALEGALWHLGAAILQAARLTTAAQAPAS